MHTVRHVRCLSDLLETKFYHFVHLPTNVTVLLYTCHARTHTHTQTYAHTHMYTHNTHMHPHVHNRKKGINVLTYMFTDALAYCEGTRVQHIRHKHCILYVHLFLADCRSLDYEPLQNQLYVHQLHERAASRKKLYGCVMYLYSCCSCQCVHALNNFFLVFFVSNYACQLDGCTQQCF